MLDSQCAFHRHTAPAAINEFDRIIANDVFNFRRNGPWIRDNYAGQAGSRYRANTVLQGGSPDDGDARDRQLIFNF